MSTYFYGSIYKKINDEWELIYKNINMNCVKNFMSGWDIDADEVYDVDDSLKSLAHNIDKFETCEWLGYIEKSKIDDFYLKFKDDSESNYLDSTSLVFDINNIDYLQKIIDNISKDNICSDINMWVKKSDEEKKKEYDKYFSVYVKLNKYYIGEFYNSSSFDDIINSSKEKLKEIEENKRKWKEISTSLDYLKLSQDEKENVWESFEYEIEDEDDYYKNKLKSALQLKYTLELFSDWDNNVLFYIYNSDNYKIQNDLPELLNSKLGGF